MPHDALKITARPDLDGARLILGFSGWMDGGDVSTGTVAYLSHKLGAVPVAHIEPRDFYLYAFPGPMEMASMFRPQAQIEGGVVRGFEEPRAHFLGAPGPRVLLFQGREPNLNWAAFADCIFHVAAEFRVSHLYFVGSVTGAVPHTRDPRFRGGVSEERFKDLLETHELTPSEYAGPASFTTYLMRQAAERSLPMLSMVAEIPPYVEGPNPRCVLASVRKLGELLGLRMDLGDLETKSAELVKRLDGIVAKREELGDLVRKLEEHYDQELHHSEMDELREWFERQNFRLN